jgi:hypothetical protein
MSNERPGILESELAVVIAAEEFDAAIRDPEVHRALAEVREMGQRAKRLP